MCDEIAEIKSKFPKSIFWLCGDFNLPDINWEENKIISHQYSSSLNQLFLDLTNDLGLSQTVLNPTRGENILDLFFTNNLNLINKSSVISGVSDHEAVLIESKLSIKTKKPSSRTIHLWKQVDMSKLRQDAKNFNNLFIQSHSHNKKPISTQWSCINKNLELILDDNVPTKNTSTKIFPPWITTQTKRLIRNKNLWYQKAKQRNDPESWKKYKDYKKLAQKHCRKSHDNYVEDLITSDKSNKKFWSYVKSQRTENNGISDLNNNNKTVSDPKEKANIFNNQFSTVFSKPCDTTYPTPKIDKNSKTLNNITVSKKGVLNLLKNINPDKATGPDNIPGMLLKLCAFELHETFTIFFQNSLNQGQIPDDWKTAHIFPLFKKGDKSNAENYRPISLTSIACKILEHIVHSTVMDFLDSKNFLSSVQHGFRQKRSCETQLLTTLRDFSQTLNTSGQTDAILLDFSKAFDKVDHKLLLSKINNTGIHGPLFDWISSFLSNRTQYVIVDGCVSEPKAVLSGVPQGTVLGPLFFLIYINDISENLSPGTFLRLFADDSLLYRVIRCIQDAITLQKDLLTLQAWCIKNKMEFHPKKCQVIRITNKIKPIINSYSIYGVVLEVFNSVKYLGVTIDSNLNWKDQCNNVHHKACFMMSFLERNFYRCPPHIKIKLYNALVRPILEYGCSAWDPYRKYQIEQLEKINKRAARFVTGNHKREHGETEKNMVTLGWPPLLERRNKIKLTMLFKIKSNLVHVPIDDLHPNPRKPENYLVPSSSVDPHLFSFFPSTIRLWNSAPLDLKTCTSLSSFKANLDKVTLKQSYNNLP